MKPIKLVIADDSVIARQCISSLMNLSTEIEVLGQAKDGKEILEDFTEQITNKKIDILLLDVRMPELGGLELTPKLRQLNPDQKIILFSLYDDEHVIQESMRLNVNAFINKNTDYNELISAIKNVYRNGQYISSFVTDYLYKTSQSALKQEVPRKLYIQQKSIEQSHLVNCTKLGLSERERDILALICKEFTTKEIAEKLFISHRTVEGYRNKLLEKLNVKNVAGLVIQAMNLNLVSFSDKNNQL